MQLTWLSDTHWDHCGSVPEFEGEATITGDGRVTT